MKSVAIFASGTGSNFEKIADDVYLKQHMTIEVVICDRVNAPVIKKAKSRGLATYVFNMKDFKDKQAFEAAILQKVQQCEFIFLAGYMRIISPYFLENFRGDIINLHPSLLPKYKGKDAIQQAFSQGEAQIGISIHYVNEELDGGQVIAQRALDVLPQDTLETVTERIHQLEHQLYPQVIAQLIVANEKGNKNNEKSIN